MAYQQIFLIRLAQQLLLWFKKYLEYLLGALAIEFVVAGVIIESFKSDRLTKDSLKISSDLNSLD